MPVKQRIAKARQFDDYRRQQLLEGPDAVLLADVGYLHSISVGSFDRASPEEQAVVLDEMRADWARYGADLMTWWRSGEHAEGIRPWAWVPAGSPDTLPWAAEAFGEP
jgi:hypothetical protein